MIKKIEDDYLAKVYEKLPVVLLKGKDATVWDVNGKDYIDCMGGYGVAIVGHHNPYIIEALKKQIDELITCHGSLYNETRAKFVEKLVKISPKGLDNVHLSNSGAESVECALKLARKYTKKPGIIAMTRSYHGKTLGALSVTWNKKYRSAFDPLIPEITFAPFGDMERIREAITDNIGAIIIEPIQGESGIHPPPEGFLEELREICSKKEILLILDEIQTGFGRTGKMWCHEHWNVIPDIMCLAKGIGGGMPLGATLATKEIMSSFTVGDHTSTVGGNPLVCAAGIATIDYILEYDLLEKVSEKGKFFKEKMEKIQDEHQIVREIRGLGLMLGMEIKFDIRNILFQGVERGIIMLYSGKNILRFLPPYVITEDQINRVIDVLDLLISEEENIRFA